MILEKFIEPDTLEAICNEIVPQEVTREYSLDEINAFEVELANKVIEIDARTSLATKIKKFIETTMDPEMLMETIRETIENTPELSFAGTKSLLSEKEVLKTKLKDRSFTQEEDLFKYLDQENGIVAFYDKNGYLISSRTMFPQERQAKLFNIKQA
jgi:hypothetical protein